MTLDTEFRREMELAMRDDDCLVAAMRALLEQAWAFIKDPMPR